MADKSELCDSNEKIQNKKSLESERGSTKVRKNLIMFQKFYFNIKVQIKLGKNNGKPFIN